jgi:predicted RNase H-like HicB family nuclease
MTFTATIWEEDGIFIAQCREFEIASQGASQKEALDNLSEAVSLHFEPPIATILPTVTAFEVDLPLLIADSEGEHGVA